MKVISVGSSSSGNSYIIKTEETNIILDAGIAMRKIMAAAAEENLGPEDIDAVLITHEHTDHVKSIGPVASKCVNAVFYASRGTQLGCAGFERVPEERCRTIAAGDTAEFGDVTVRAFELSHDAAEPVGYTILSGGEQLTVVTDTGIVTDEIYDEMRTADLLVFEANHDENMLMYGEYPYALKRRIKGDRGHLSNETTGEVLGRILTERYNENPAAAAPRIMLAHLSDKNNAPLYARQAVEQILKDSGFERDEHYIMTIAPKDEVSYLE